MEHLQSNLLKFRNFDIQKEKYLGNTFYHGLKP